MTEMKKPKKSTWFFMVFLIPIIVIVTFAVVAWMVIDDSAQERFKQWSSSLPVVSNFVQTNAEGNNIVEQIEVLEGRVLEAENQVGILHSELQAKEQHIQDLEADNEQLTEQLSVEADFTAGETSEFESNSANDSIAQIYENMSAKNAARIISELNLDETIYHLMEIAPDHRSNIIARLESERAAEIMKRLAQY
ncbi:magnesium transporter MgtE N-terminal domain-containing protein [Alkalihalobacillus pseudalcaliphilus]|uniref:magnesium transporter MgtE N-terminal domain-containing protein n=1 Tax=Alkalihalobacillus pseudalcaliphilus TaxID=79884 RepID=UPI00064D8E4C|nr:hypothetical protein [Alkalihalobacillus pseudalcaliphilus]KMK77219.1 hypothetical protein AB990_06630 [Alkalihalobacillus pseudalcaliphilus]